MKKSRKAPRLVSGRKTPLQSISAPFRNLWSACYFDPFGTFMELISIPISLCAIFVFLLSLLVYASEPVHSADSIPILSATQEDCEIFYEKARRLAEEAERIDPDGLFSSAKRGGVSGSASAFANLYLACIERNNTLKTKPRD